MSTYTIPHAADTITNAITKVESTVTSGNLTSNANLVQANVIKSYVDDTVNSTVTKTENGVTTQGQLLFTKSFVSADQTIPNTIASSITVAHGLGTVPLLYNIYLKCVNPSKGYSVGDLATFNMDNGSNFAMYCNATNVVFYAPHTNQYYIQDLTTTSNNPWWFTIDGTLTIANDWRLVIKAFA
jgi:hypothetical protein